MTGNLQEQQCGIHGKAHPMAEHRRSVIPYEAIDSSATFQWHSSEIRANRCLSGQYTAVGQVLTSLSAVPWTHRNRSFRHLLHSWDPLHVVLIAYERTRKAEYLKAACEYATDWLEHVQKPVLNYSAEEILALAAGKDAVEWSDMSAGQRIHKLSYLYDVLRTLEPDVEHELFRESIAFHCRLLGTPKFLNVRNNHGLNQILGFLAALRRLEFIENRDALRRDLEKSLLELIVSSFSNEGVLREHSSRYHHYVLTLLLNARHYGLLPPSETIGQLLQRAEDVLAWMLMPDRRLVPFGDTGHSAIGAEAEFAAHLASEKLRCVLTDGRSGAVRPQGCAALLETGYAFVRAGAGKMRDDTYFAQMAAFSSRVHKHADHASVVWQEGALPVLTDPGRYQYQGRTDRESALFKRGFWYSDPARVYVESTHAHTCLEIDGASYNRALGQPFGSALKQAGKQGELYVTRCELTHEGTISHAREVVLHPGKFLLVIDAVADSASGEHSYAQWFALHPVWNAAEGASAPAGGLRFEAGDRSLAIVDLLGGVRPGVSRGVTEPRLEGWFAETSAKLVPSNSVRIVRHGVAAVMATLVILDDTQDVAVHSAQPGPNQLPVELCWSTHERRSTLRLERSKEGGLTAELSS